jgi:hypothetical protein
MEWGSFEKRHFRTLAAHERADWNSGAYPNVPVS